MRLRLQLVAFGLLLLAVSVPAHQSALDTAQQVTNGVLLYRLDDPALLSPEGPVAVQAIRLDPRIVTLEIGRASHVEPARETVEAIAARRPGAIAAINGGFFSLETGKPTAFLKTDGRVVSGTSRPRGAVGIDDRRGVTTLLFDRVAVTRTPGRRPGYRPLLSSSPHDWSRVPHAISGAGLLVLGGREFREWTDERIAAGFQTARHPRTVIGTDAKGAIWLITVDGRNPSLSLGMSFGELQRLSKRLGLRSALNLDGGGSTTMWVGGRIVNHPSDPAGPRKVSDAILVVPRRR
ncbi:MAG TPA: phosphodiester glycosidase family protein [Vicinamibacterales bacterium]|nr:phosphodiester glycosidase family protein [Vicinamibacterales bacterium]